MCTKYHCSILGVVIQNDKFIGPGIVYERKGKIVIAKKDMKAIN